MSDEWTEDDVIDVIINPFHAILRDALVTDELWVRANVRLIKKLGSEAYLRRLLEVLRTVTQEETRPC